MSLIAGHEAAAVARSWGVARLWSATSRAIDQLLLAHERSARQPVWQRHLHETRERTVFEGHVERLVGPVVAASQAAGAPLAAARAVSETVRPWPGERWSSKLARSRRSVRHASMRESQHMSHSSGGDQVDH
jgi:hypothetical protein